MPLSRAMLLVTKPVWDSLAGFRGTSVSMNEAAVRFRTSLTPLGTLVQSWAAFLGRWQPDANAIQKCMLATISKISGMDCHRIHLDAVRVMNTASWPLCGVASHLLSFDEQRSLGVGDQ